MWRNRKALLASMFFAIAGAGAARAQDVSLLPASLAFSNQAIGTTSAAQAITLK